MESNFFEDLNVHPALINLDNIASELEDMASGSQTGEADRTPLQGPRAPINVTPALVGSGRITSDRDNIASGTQPGVSVVETPLQGPRSSTMNVTSSEAQRLQLNFEEQLERLKESNIGLQEQVLDVVHLVRNQMVELDKKVDEVSKTVNQEIKTPSPKSVSLEIQTPSPSSIPINNPETPSIPSQLPVNVTMSAHILKPRDIKTLGLSQLTGIDAAARLQLFFDSVEKCAIESGDRFQIAVIRMEGELAVLVHSAKRAGKIESWDSLKVYLKKEFSIYVDFHEAWQSLSQVSYDWTMNPYAFIHKLKCNYAALKANFPLKSLPDQDQFLKQKLISGFPKAHQVALTPFLDRDITAEDFVTHVQHQKNILGYTNQIPVQTIPMSDSSNQRRSSDTTLSTTQTSDDLQQRIRNLEAQLRDLRKVPKRTNKYCAYCKATDHYLRDCNKSPPIGLCFDCLRKGCRRGQAGCTGSPSSPKVNLATTQVNSNEDSAQL